MCGELQARGYEAHDTDLHGNAVWVHRETGEIAATQSGPEMRSPDWLGQHEWTMVRDRIEALAERAGSRTVFLCGMTKNQSEMSHLFTRVVFLSIDVETLRRRVASRTTNDFGKAPHELAAIEEWHSIVEDEHRQFGAVIVDATRPLRQVTDDVLDAAI